MRCLCKQRETYELKVEGDVSADLFGAINVIVILT